MKAISREEDRKMKHTIDSLMAELAVARFPERWRGFFDEVMADFDVHGCLAAAPAYYDRLEGEYAPFGEELPIFREAAREVGGREALARFLSLLVYAQRDRGAIRADLAALDLPRPPGGGHSLAYDMLPGLAVAAGIPDAVARMRSRGIGDALLLPSIRAIGKTVGGYRLRYGGNPGFHLLLWHQLTLDGRLFFIGRLQIEVPAAFPSAAVVYRHRDGRTLALADGIPLHRDGYALGSKNYEDTEGARTPTVTETETAFCGYPFDERGYVKGAAVTLPKSEWTRVLGKGDPVISLHIPAGGKLTDELVSETMAEIRAFLATYFADCDYRAFFCHSWMMDPQLDEMLGDDANITKFRRRFHPLTARSMGRGVFNFIFHRMDTDFRIEELPGDTSFQRKLKELYLAGGAIYELHGYFF